MLHTLLATALVSAGAHVNAIPVHTGLPLASLDTAVAAPVAKRLVLNLQAGGTVTITGL